MGEKQLDLSKTVYELCSEYPELIETLVQIGFQDITKPGMLNTMGRFMTLKKGAIAKKLEYDKIIQALTDQGYQVSSN